MYLHNFKTSSCAFKTFYSVNVFEIPLGKAVLGLTQQSALTLISVITGTQNYVIGVFVIFDFMKLSRLQ